MSDVTRNKGRAGESWVCVKQIVSFLQLHALQVCDGEELCVDGSDETLICDQFDEICQSLNGAFSCTNERKCITPDLRCNGVDDCKDGSDENDCPEYCKSVGLLSCETKGGCLTEDKWCNMILDCPDMSDETHCKVELYKKHDEVCNCEQVCVRRPNDTDYCYEKNCKSQQLHDFGRTIAESRTKDMSDLLQIYTPDRDEVQKYGISARNLIASCSFDNRDCSYKDFHEWRSDDYGNCFTFNSPFLEKYVEDSKGNYVKQDVLPREGFNIAPGILTTASIKREDVLRVGSPYGECNDWEWEHLGNYSQSACFKLCAEGWYRQMCDCKRSVNPLFDKLNDKSQCNVLNVSQCADPFVSPSSGSEVAIPNVKFLRALSFYKRFQFGKDACNRPSDDKNTAYLHVYFEDNSYKLIQESPAYTWVTLVSNLGGSIGLFVGLSLITALELFFFFAEVFSFCCFKRRHRIRDRKNSEQQLNVQRQCKQQPKVGTVAVNHASTQEREMQETWMQTPVQVAPFFVNPALERKSGSFS
ncbi:unnamed protein product [Darwinula stevensoni]|uniref:Uncharacterized protein n=1 Tax=Darwinula stevensoni TaxID=69355 RepID=A0A7R9A9I3_9CRUS|nr:unnamed protein product [Darwinula stevensoni]CAG0897374.1 unnamed protein product [Darwinula stevensoni]